METTTTTCPWCRSSYATASTARIAHRGAVCLNKGIPFASKQTPDKGGKPKRPANQRRAHGATV